jgi:UDP-N-acetylmuramoyl-tripeptide--D-alanyl-D-alanine ligase
MFKLSEIAQAIEADYIGEEVTISGFSTDTRKVLLGELFIAIVGNRVDGHDFADEAQKSGAKALLVSRKVTSSLPQLIVKDTIAALGKLAKSHRKKFNIPFIALTGSCGKTTTKEMLASIFSLKGPVLATAGNLNTDIGVPLTLLKLSAEHQVAVIEMGARKKGDIDYLMSLVDPTVSLITNAGVAHLEVFGSEQAIAVAKGEIIENLKPEGKAVINLEDAFAPYWQSLLKSQHCITFGLHTGDIFCTELQEEITRAHFTLMTDIGSVRITLPASGRHNVQNAIAAAAVSRAIGVGLEEIALGLQQFVTVAGRMQFKKGVFGAVVIDDTYNANPISVKAALSVLANGAGTKIFVMGDMFEVGPNAVALHQAIGKEAKEKGIDMLLGIGAATEGAVQAFGVNGKHYLEKTTLIRELKEKMSAAVILLVKGSRGMRMEEIVDAVLEPLGDRAKC